MDWKEFLTVDVRALLYLPIFFILMAFLIWSLNIMPCLTRQSVNDSWIDSWCSIRPASGQMVSWTSLTYVMALVLLVLVPYILTCIVDHYLPEKKKHYNKKKSKK